MNRETVMNIPLKRGSIWWANLGNPHGNVQGGTRPVLVLGSRTALKFGTTVTVVPITSKIKRIDMSVHVTGFNYKKKQPCMALCEQITTISKESLLEPISSIKFNLVEIDVAIKEELGIEI